MSYAHKQNTYVHVYPQSSQNTSHNRKSSKPCINANTQRTKVYEIKTLKFGLNKFRSRPKKSTVGALLAAKNGQEGGT